MLVEEAEQARTPLADLYWRARESFEAFLVTAKTSPPDDLGKLAQKHTAEMLPALREKLERSHKPEVVQLVFGEELCRAAKENQPEVFARTLEELGRDPESALKELQSRSRDVHCDPASWHIAGWEKEARRGVPISEMAPRVHELLLERRRMEGDDLFTLLDIQLLVSHLEQELGKKLLGSVEDLLARLTEAGLLDACYEELPRRPQSPPVRIIQGYVPLMPKKPGPRLRPATDEPDTAASPDTKRVAEQTRTQDEQKIDNLSKHVLDANASAASDSQLNEVAHPDGEAPRTAPRVAPSESGNSESKSLNASQPLHDIEEPDDSDRGEHIEEGDTGRVARVLTRGTGGMYFFAGVQLRLGPADQLHLDVLWDADKSQVPKPNATDEAIQKREDRIRKALREAGAKRKLLSNMEEATLILHRGRLFPDPALNPLLISRSR